METQLAIEECLTLGLEGVRGIVAESKASSRRTLGLCLEHKIGLGTFVPRTCAIRQAREAWGQQPPALPLLVEKPGRTQDEAPRHWPGRSVLRPGEVEDSEGRLAQETLRFVVVHASQLAQQQAQASAAAPVQAAEAVADHVRQVHTRWCACRPDAAAASRAPGGITRSAMASWQRAAARAAPGEDGRRRRTPLRPSQAIAWW